MKVHVAFIYMIIVMSMQLVSCRSTQGGEDHANLESWNTIFPSTIPEISLGGAHIVVKDQNKPRIIRSQAPRNPKDYQELTAFGVTDVIIFKKESGHEVKDELAEFKNRGLPGARLHHIPMAYKDFSDFEEPCRQTVEALKFIRDARKDDDRMILFHCTVGEDRTGYLAGLVILLETGGNTREVFKTEMCDKGYSSGNRVKPKNVTTRIDEDLTPVFAKMALLIKSGQLSWSKLDASKICATDPFNETLESEARKEFNPRNFRCR